MIDDDDPFAMPVMADPNPEPASTPSRMPIVIDETDPFAVPPTPAVKIVSRSPGARTGKGRPVLSIVQPPDVDPDDPFEGLPRAAREVTHATLPFDRRHGLDDPFSSELQLPCVIAERSRDYIDVVVFGVDGSRNRIRSIDVPREKDALAAAETVAINCGAMLINGVHPEIVVSALESGIKAALRSIEARVIR